MYLLVCINRVQDATNFDNSDQFNFRKELKIVRSWTLREKIVILIKALFYVWWMRLKEKSRKIQKFLRRKTRPVIEQQERKLYQEHREQLMLDFPSVGNHLFTIMLMIDILVILVIVVSTYIAITYFGPQSRLTDPELRRAAPTAVIVDITPEVSVPWWETEINDWLTASESLELREKENAINFVLLHADEVRYASTQSFQLTESWEQTRPTFIEAVSIKDTAVVVQIDGRQFNLNAYQPFTWRDAPGHVVMVDGDRMTWVRDVTNINPIPFEEIQLDTSIKPNPKLEISFIKQ